jgi:hypothetical protein
MMSSRIRYRIYRISRTPKATRARLLWYSPSQTVITQRILRAHNSMLKQLDTLIGFAVVMSVVSLLIMVATQAISSVLALRGKNLRDGLQALFLGLVPTLDEREARSLAELILKRPVISDCAWSIKASGFESWKLGTAIRPEECLEAIRRIAFRNYRRSGTITFRGGPKGASKRPGSGEAGG